MLDFTSLPASKAKAVYELSPLDDKIEYTFTGCVDEGYLYEELRCRLGKLESLMEPDEKELKQIEEKASAFKIATEEKEEIALRCKWLNTLYQVNSNLAALDTKEKSSKVMGSLQTVQTSPFKKMLIERISSLEASFENKPPVLTVKEKLMHEAVEKADSIFLNLGGAGRDHIVSLAIAKHNDNVQIAHLNALAVELEERVKALTKISKANELKNELEELPLIHYFTLSEADKLKAANLLIANKEWGGLSELQRKIIKLNKELEWIEQEKGVAENDVVTSTADAAQTIDIGRMKSGIYKANDTEDE